MLQRARGLHFIRRKQGSMSRVRLFGSLVSFNGIVATFNLLTWTSSSCVNQLLSCLLALLEFTHSFLVSSTRLVRRANDFALK